MEKTNDKEIKKNYQTKRPEYTNDEMDYRSYLIKRLVNAKNQRDNQYIEFDDMDFLTYYEENAKSANSYIRPKKNEEDTRIVTGITNEKVNTLLSSILNFNLEPNVIAYNENDFFVEELGETMEDIIRKTREMEDYDAKRVNIYKEQLDQGNAFVEEVWSDVFKVNKKLNDTNWRENVDPKKINWKTKIEKAYSGCQANLLSGTKVYLGDVREFMMKDQPYVFTASVESYENLKRIYKNWERWQYVPRNMAPSSVTEDQDVAYRDWSLQELQDDMVEVIKYYDKPNNEFMIMLNGVMMLPIGFPLTYISPSCEYPVAKGNNYPISRFFAYCKSIPSKTKVDQQVLDEMLRNIILKTQQSFAPPLANNTNRLLSRRTYFPGQITRGLNPDKIKPLIDAKGVTPGEYQSFELIKGIIDQKSIDPLFAGESTGSRVTATEALLRKRQQLAKLGLPIWGIIDLEKQLAWLRLYNIIANFTKPIDERIDEVTGGLKKIYRSVSVKTPGREYDKRVINFDEEKANTLQPEQIKAEEDLLSTPGNKVAVTYLNPKELQGVKLNWFINIEPTEKDTSELKRAMFIQNLQDAFALFGPQAVNLEYAKQRFSNIIGEDQEKFFNPMMDQMQQQMMSMQAQGMGGQEAGGAQGKEMTEGMRALTGGGMANMGRAQSE